MKCSHALDGDDRRSRRCSTVSGIVTSGASPATMPVKPGGVTPTIVNGTRSTRTVRPITAGSPPKRRFQQASLITATAPAAPPPTRSSEGSKRRPAAG